MTSAEFLTEWKERHRLTDKQAAEWLEIHESTFKRQRRGSIRECRQTVKLAKLYAIHGVAWLEVAEAALKVGRMLPRRP